jgi:N-acetyl-anhydromuramyl-L-alanine amidase AmpD
MAATAPKVFYTRGQIAEAKFQKGLVVSLRLCRGNYSRVVNVTSHILGEELAALDSENLRGQMFTFGVQGSELRTIIRYIGVESVSSIPGDRGIEEATRDVTRPRSESDNTDYPYATRFVPASSFRAGGDNRAINRVVIHITDGGSSIEGPISWFQNPASGVSAHYIVGLNGEVVQMVRDRDIAWHANNANGDSIGIEHCARAPGAQSPSDPGLMPTPLQYAASGVLVRWLCEQYGIPMDRDHILGHSEADTRTTHSRCPNAVWDWDYYMDMLTTGTSLPPPGNETTRRLRNRLHPSGGSHA